MALGASVSKGSLPNSVIFCFVATTFAKPGIKSLLLCIMQTQDMSSSLSVGGLIFLKVLNFSESSF